MCLRLVLTLLCVIIEVTFSSLLCCKLKIMGILQSPTVFSVIDVFVLQVVSTVLQSPTVFILFTITMLYSQCAVCVHQRFLFCLSPYLFSEWHIVPQLCVHIKQLRTHSRKALYERKASRRLGKQMRGFSGFCLKPTHHNNAFTMQNEENCAFYAAFWENPVVYGVLRIIFRTFAAK